MRNKVKQFIVSIALLIMSVILIGAQPLYAQDINVQVSVNSNQAVLGSAIQLSLKIDGVKNVSEIQLPEIAGFESQYIGPSRQMTIVNGQYSQSITFNYSLLPLEVGTFQIPSFQLQIEGQSFTTQAITINVMDIIQGDGSSSDGDPVKLSDKMFLDLTTEKEKVYLNEQLPLTLKLYFTGINLAGDPPVLEAPGFIMEEFPQAKQYNQMLNGVQYNVVEFNTFVTPTREGELVLGPANIEGSMIVSSGRANRPSRSIFGDDFFDSFFSRQERRPVRIKSNAAAITVLPVPEDGKPSGYSNAVGKYNFDVTASPTEVSVGDPITLKMRVTGIGDTKSIQMPELKGFDEFKVYDPIIKDEGSEKVLEQVVIPKSVDVKEVPAIEFSYFDVDQGRYKIIRQGPFPIHVQEILEDEFKIVGGALPPVVNKPEKFGEDIVFIKDSIGRITKKGARLYTNILFYLFLIIVYGFIVAGYFVVREKHKIKSDARYAKKLQAPHYARKGLNQAKHLIEKNKQTHVYDTLFKTLQDYFTHKLHITSGAVNIETIKNCLPGTGDERGVIEKLKAVFDRCDQVRYASLQLSQKEMIESYNDVVKIIDYFERNVT